MKIHAEGEPYTFFILLKKIFCFVDGKCKTFVDKINIAEFILIKSFQFH